MIADESPMNKLLVAILYLSSTNGQGNSVDCVAFFGIALGGAGALILLSTLVQLFGKGRSER